ncbi:MAG TPA: hypothetical protein VGG99_19660 [Acetobacteraceae bacterium]|jgi:hypothetical protein
MSLPGAIGSGLHAAFLLARGRSEGMHYLQADTDSVHFSFWALAVASPTIVCWRLITWVEKSVPADASHVLALDMVSYVVGWLGFLVLSFYVVGRFGAASRWPRFVVAWNWCNVVESLLCLAGFVPGLLHAPPAIDEASQIIATGWALWIEWYSTRLALDTGAFAAAVLVVLDQAIGWLLAGWNLALLGH